MAAPSQGMMLNERPSDSIGGSSTMYGAGGNISAAAGSIGNYKGVMLCNRPFAGAAAAAKGCELNTASGKEVFVTGKVKSEIGLTKKNIQKDKLLRKRVKQETALTRHKKWLADLQLTKQALEEQYMEDMKRKEESKQKFMQREACMRQRARELAHEAKSDEGGGDTSHCPMSSLEEDAKKSSMLPAEFGRRDIPEGKKPAEEDAECRSRVDPTELREAEKRRKKNGQCAKPMWAMTETRAEVDILTREEDEVEELLEFTKGLDFEKYIRDAEVQSMIDQVKKRIMEIESQPEVDEDDNGGGESDCNDKGGRRLNDEESILEARILKLTDKNLRKLGERGVKEGGAGAGCDVGPVAATNNNQEEDDNMSIARTAMSEGGRSVRSIHSTRSLAAVAERVREGLALEPREMAEAKEGPVEDIVVVTHKDDGGLRLGGKNNVSNLPYIRRNPAL
ncbi:unnamed protein product [Discosporangium mesarthrocarpum]